MILTLRLQDPPLALDADLWRLWLEPDPEEGIAIRARVDPARPVVWRELDELKQLVELQYQGVDASVAAYVTARKSLRTFWWLKHGQSRIDLSKSALTELAVDASAPLTVALPRTLTTLRLLEVSAWNSLRVESDDDGARLAIWAWSSKKPVRAIAGLPALAKLSVGLISKLDLALVDKHRELRALEIFGDDAGAAITNLGKLSILSKLESLSIRNAFHTDFSQLPSSLPALKTFAVDGVRAEAAKILRARGATVRGVRTDAWLRANADNPFREWTDEHGPSLGARATRAYRKAHAAIDAKKPTRKQAEAILRAFVEAFNAVEADVDTIMREEIDAAYARVADRVRAQVPEKEATKWFDAWREF